jgi:hypothetical protein
MITDVQYFRSDLEEILSLFVGYKKDMQFIKSISIKDFSKENISKQFNETFRSFPYYIESSSDKLGISYYTLELFDLYYDLDSVDKLDSARINQTKSRFLKDYLDINDQYIIYEIIEDYFHSLTYFYEIFIAKAKKYSFFVEITNEEIILKNLLSLYKGILNDTSKQIRVFWGLTLTKKISDKIVEMLCDFIEQRLLVLNPHINTDSITNKLTFKSNKIEPILWKGTQQELCELFSELSLKGWIPEIPDGKRKKIAESITEIFDLQTTKHSLSSKHTDSFYQQFKGEMIDGKREFPFLSSKKYSLKFDKIKENPNSEA